MTRDWLSWIHGKRDVVAFVVAVVCGTAAVLIWLSLDEIVSGMIR